MVSSCDACGLRTRRASARFCPSCGGTLAVLDEQPEEAPPAEIALPAVEESLLRPVAWLYGLFLAIAGALVLAAKYAPRAQPRHEVIAMGVEAAIVFAFATRERERILPLLRVRALGARELGLAAAAAVFVIGFILLYLRAFRLLDVQEIAIVEPYRDAGWPVWSAFVLLAVVAPVVEEIAFRGYIYTRVARVAGERDAMFIQAGLFALAHLLPMVFVSHFVIGLVLGALRRASSSLLPSMLVHATWNAAVLGLELGRG